MKAESGLVELIISDLREKIVSGKIAPGEKLRQDEIAARYGTSSNPVREAFQRLENTGLVVLRPRRGVIAAPIKASDAIEVAHMRASLEVLALKQAMRAPSPAVVDAARGALAISGASHAIATWITTNRDFHRSLYQPCGWQRLLDSIEELWLTSDRHLHAVWAGVAYQDKSHAEHEMLLAAYEAGKVDEASHILSAHIIEAGNALAALLEQTFPEDEGER